MEQPKFTHPNDDKHHVEMNKTVKNSLEGELTPGLSTAKVVRKLETLTKEIAEGDFEGVQKQEIMPGILAGKLHMADVVSEIEQRFSRREMSTLLALTIQEKIREVLGSPHEQLHEMLGELLGKPSATKRTETDPDLDDLKNGIKRSQSLFKMAEDIYNRTPDDSPFKEKMGKDLEKLRGNQRMHESVLDFLEKMMSS